jgi:lipopolysaccharide export system protein LptA
MRRCWILFAGLFLTSSLALAAPPVLPGTGSREPVEISADRMEADDASKVLVFIGHAVAQQGDVTINGDRLTIHYTAKDGDVDRIIAEGNVRITQKERVATGGRAEYFRAEERVVMTGSPKVSEGSNSVQGDEVILYVRENRSVVKSGQGGRVSAVFQPKERESR